MVKSALVVPMPKPAAAIAYPVKDVTDKKKKKKYKKGAASI